MPIRLLAAGFLLAAAALAVAQPAHAQLGSVNNPPPQRLFNMDQPKRLDNGLGTMAERRQQLAKMRAQKRAARRAR